MRRKSNVLSMLALSLLTAAAAALGACSSDDGADLSKFNSISYKTGSIYTEDDTGNQLSSELVVITSDEQFKALSLDGYNSDYFNDNALLLINFRYASSESDIALHFLGEYEGKLYPVFTLKWANADGINTDDEKFNVYSVEIEKNLIDGISAGEILVINSASSLSGSCYYRSVNDLF